jgi:hypothetical protein
MSYQYDVQPTSKQKQLMQKFTDKFQALHNEINESIEHSRGRSSCLVKLEEASFWLNKAITKND